MKVWKTFLGVIAATIVLSGCVSSHERVVEKQPVIKERVVEKSSPDTTINVR